MQREHQQNPKIEAKQIQKSKRDWGKGGGEEKLFSRAFYWIWCIHYSALVFQGFSKHNLE